MVNFGRSAHNFSVRPSNLPRQFSGHVFQFAVAAKKNYLYPMLKEPYLHTLLDLDIPRNFTTVCIYTHQKTERLNYVCGFIFNHVLKLNYTLTSDSSEFRASMCVRINYSTEDITGIFQFIPQTLLFEKEISEAKPEPVSENGMICFYKNDKKKDFSFDIFSSVFYFISRYEEWQVFEPDGHGRFEASSSLLYKNKLHLKPVVDVWIMNLARALQDFYPGLIFPEKKFKVISTIDVDNLYAYRSKGIIRTFGAGVKDLLKLDLKNFKERILVLTGKKKDPFDIYEFVSDFCFEKKIPLICFFLFRTGTKYDRTVDPRSDSYRPVFKILKDNHALVGLHPSYNSSVEKELLMRERDLLSAKTTEKITFSRQHYLRFNIRTTPALLLEQGFEADFSMGFASAPGFRAGTSHPFYYYDFNSEKISTLLFVPFCVMDGVYTVYENIPAEPAYEEMLTIAKEIKKVNGLFISVFHERTFSDHLYKGFGTLYKKLQSAVKEL